MQTPYFFYNFKCSKQVMCVIQILPLIKTWFQFFQALINLQETILGKTCIWQIHHEDVYKIMFIKTWIASLGLVKG